MRDREAERERQRDTEGQSQRITRREKKAALGDQCKEIEEKDRMGKPSDLFKKTEIPGEYLMQGWAQ